eukprot:4742872-Pyramimonas_sp.AAC.1
MGWDTVLDDAVVASDSEAAGEPPADEASEALPPLLDASEALPPLEDGSTREPPPKRRRGRPKGSVRRSSLCVDDGALVVAPAAGPL